MTPTLTEHLATWLENTPPSALCVAFSGGIDSSALLHALAHLPAARKRGLRALHIEHGLHPDSSAWGTHCQQFCDTLNVPFSICQVTVANSPREGLEAAARRSRYRAFEHHLISDECLLLAQHRDDQIETVLLKLLRGAGPEGLGGMRPQRALGKGQLWRPLLGLSRRHLDTYVRTHHLHCINDPSNTDTRLSRNYLRHEILPRLHQHWPQTDASIEHSATLCQAAADTLRTQWLPLFEMLHNPTHNTLSVPLWLKLPSALREPILDHWLHGRGLTAPSAAQRRQIQQQCQSRTDCVPCIRWRSTQLHIWKGQLWALPSADVIPCEWEKSWDGHPLRLPDGGWLRLSDPQVRLKEPLKIRLRRGGEQIKPVGQPHTRTLRKLFQQAELPPWQRQACPLIHIEDELIAVGDLWCNTRGMALFQHHAAYPKWQPAGSPDGL